MEESLRVMFTPFFWLAEVATLAICLRDLAGSRKANENVLRESLLNDTIRSMLRQQTDITTLVTDLAAVLAPHDDRFARLPELFRTGGCGALEAALHDISLELLAAAPGRPGMKQYVTLQIDGRNLTACWKQLRRPLDRPPELLPGGAIRPAAIGAVFSRQDTPGLVALAMGQAGRVQRNVQTDDIELILRDSGGKLLGRLAREPGGSGIILDYLWRCNGEARNIGLLNQVAVAGIDAVSAELQR
jgi:hypothetical protein